jgi:pilus assembly protein CpaC
MLSALVKTFDPRRQFRSAAAAVAILAGLACLPAAAQEARSPVISVTAPESAARSLNIGVGKSVVVDLPRDVKDVLVGNPKIANAVVRSARRIFVMAAEMGQTTIVFFDEGGRQIAALDIAVTRDLNGVRAAKRRVLPNAEITIEGIGESVVLHGKVGSPAEAQQAFDMAARLVGDPNKVTNALTVGGRDQVNLRVVVAEVQRDTVKQLGIDLNRAIGGGSSVLNLATQNPFSVAGTALSGTALEFNPKSGGADATLRAMERAGVMRLLAEPNLTAISGETATFLAGGEFPVPAGRDCQVDQFGRQTCTLRIEYKKFGVSLNFTPVVMSEGRISLKVMSEASELTMEDAFTLPGGNGQTSLTIPAIKTRRTDTTVEVPSGGSLVLAGMLQERSRQQINGLPGLMNLPVVGQLFRSRDYMNRQTELMFIVTPYVVRATAPRNLSRPDDGFADASDPSAFLLGRINRIYGISGQVDPRRPLHGQHGFIMD